MCSQYNLNNFAKIKRFLRIHYFVSGKPKIAMTMIKSHIKFKLPFAL
nr:MAG TPA: hypothetical protein [Caudoviricetes sp.]DAQ47797.1 MAG TPA: hypothetical protein [Caudoviricetes sp.]DAQ94797.1 MAG TPA: hypothetical protein [Caudoviricetes sp.]DAS54204.1 MAG TPA: hypothetical protein [Caudoviricetes sp.]